jgi:hypothetical protein
VKKHALVALSLSILFSGGCAMSNPENRPMTTRVSKTMMPSTPQGIILASPLLLPVGAVAFAYDSLLYHPLTKTDDAWRDTKRACFRGFGEEGRFVSDCGSLPVRAVGVPVIYLLDWSIRLFDDVPPAPEDKEEIEMGTFPFAVVE